MNEYYSIFYGELDDRGYQISYILLSRNIKHEYVPIEKDFYFTIKTMRKLREISGFEEIQRYLERYMYVYEFPEVIRWSY